MISRNLSRRILAIVALLGLININIPVFADTDAWNGTGLRPYYGIGTQDNPFLIKSAEEFAFLMQNYDYNNGICYQKYYKLTCDLDMSACPWTYGMTYTNNKSFIAHFDGDGHKISNINILVEDKNFEQNIGIFPMLGGDEEFVSGIENLEISGITITFEKKTFTGKNYFNIGGLVGKMFRNSYIRNCIVNNFKINDAGATIDLGESGAVYLGALVGVQKNYFGGPVTQDLDNVNIITCYGAASADLGNTKGGKFNMNLIQGENTERTINGIKWYKKNNNGISFYPVSIKVHKASTDANGHNFKAEVSEGSAVSYRWLVDGVAQNSKTAECTVPHDVKDRSIAVEALDANGNVIGTDAELVEPADLKVVINAVKNGNSYNLSSKIIGEGANALASDFIYEWKDMTSDEKVVGSSATLVGALSGHTYLLEAKHRRWKFCRIGNYYSLATPIFVCRNGITQKTAGKYTIDGKTIYPAGDDNNDGTSPEKAVNSLKKAYSLIKSDKIGENLIVIMGDYDEDVFNKYELDDDTKPNRFYFEKKKKAIITGQYGNIANGMLQMATSSCMIEADTRFDNITIHKGTNPMKRLELLAQENNLTFGYGIEFAEYGTITGERGMIFGTNAENVTIFGGFLDYTNPAANHKENTIKLLSGYYARVIAGGQFSKVVEETGNIEGNPRNPIRTNIVIDICNTKNPNACTYDVALAVTGQTNGSCYAATSLEIGGSSRVGRAVGGNLGYGRKTWIKNKKNKKDSPTDSFFGQSVINITGGNINEIYGTNLGRSGKLDNVGIEVNDTISTYFYGKSIINISGGRIRNTIYGAGGGGVTGLAYDDKYHTNDSYIPYILSNGEIGYGDYFKAKNKMPDVYIGVDSVINLNNTSVAINISGYAKMHGAVYGGGHGFSNQIHTSMATNQAGNLYGDCHISISGGECYGFIFGGGRGSTAYFDNNDLSGYPVINGVQKTKDYFANLAMVYGNTYVDITGGKIEGVVFAGGEGSYYRAASEDDPTNLTSSMASVIGTANLHIGGNAVLEDFVFTGGNYGNIIHTDSHPESGSTYLTITGGKFKNSIFGGGHGIVDKLHPERSIIADIEGDTHVKISGGEFEYTPEASRYDSVRYYGIYGSGRDGSIVHGNTYVEITKSLLSPQFIKDTNLEARAEGKPWDRHFTICGGGFGEVTDVEGNTEVIIDIKGEERILDVFGGGLFGNVGGSSHVTVKGNTKVRNVYGGGLYGYVGLSDSNLNGYIYESYDDVRNYRTSSTVDFLSGTAFQVCGGGLMGNIGGETIVNIGSYDAAANTHIKIDNVYGGNDVTGTIAGSNNSRYGTNVNIYGGTITGNVYGSGNGQYGIYNQALTEKNMKSLQNAAIGREHPHVASVNINISGVDETNKANILGALYLGGNNTTVGQFAKSQFDNQELGMLREKLVPNSGHAHINIGNHVFINNLVMGSNGSNRLDFIPYYTKDGATWIKGFENDSAFVEYCQGVDMPCTPILTFNADRSLDHLVGSMDSKNVVIGDFVGGGASGSMTSDSLYSYTLPAGLTITGNIVGGCKNAHFIYKEEEGPEKDKVREYVGGFIPQTLNDTLSDRLQLNIFCNFKPLSIIEDKGKKYLRGSYIFGGCDEYGVIKGSTDINLNSDLVGSEYASTDDLYKLIKNNAIEGCEVFGGGKGKNTKVHGKTRVTLSQRIHEDISYSPKAIGVYGGGMNGGVEGGSAVHIKDGTVHRVFAGASRTYVNGGTFVKVGDENSTQGSIAINTVYGGNDISGEVGYGTFTNGKGEEVKTCSYVLIAESKNVVPAIRDVYAGGNGCYENTYNDSLPRPDIDATYIDIRGGNINRMFGGSNESAVRKNSTIDIDFDGNIKYLYGGNNLTDMTVQPEWNLYRGKVGTLYGGCNLANVLYYNEEEDRLVHHGTGKNAGLIITLDHEGFSADNVFGGCRMGNVSAHRMKKGKLEPVTFADNQYGTTINIKAGKFGRVFGGNDISGQIYNGTHIQIEGGTIDEVYGAGNGEYIYQYSTEVTQVTESFDAENRQTYYKVPANEYGANATDFQKLETINAYRPNITKSFIEIGGGMLNGQRQIATITKAIYGGGNCATIKAQKAVSGDFILSIGDYCSIENLYFGSNGENLIKPEYIKSIFDYNKIGKLAQTDANGKNLLDEHMEAVKMLGLPKDFQFNRNYSNCSIGSFFIGGNRGSTSTEGNIDINIPRSLKIKEKVVGGSNQGDIFVSAESIGREGEDDLVSNGGILWSGAKSKPNIMLYVNSDATEDDAMQVYSGCFMSGKIEGEIHINITD